MSKAGGLTKAVRNVRKVVKKVDHKNKMFTYIPAGMAAPGPPLGSQLGQIGINIANFIKDFNLRTSIYKEGVPIPCYVTVNPDRSYNLTMNHPPFSYLIKQAAGIQRGAMVPMREVAGKITRKQVYEIAKLKSEDSLWQMKDLEVLCKHVIDEAFTIGIIVSNNINWQTHKLQYKHLSVHICRWMII